MSKENIVLLACGSYNPITRAHLDMFKHATTHIDSSAFNVVKNVISPVNDLYMKAALLKHGHRVEMCNRAVSDYKEISGVNIEINTTEVDANKYLLTIDALKQINSQQQGTPRIYMLAGQDLLESFFDKGSWEPQDMITILTTFGVCYIERLPSNHPNLKADLLTYVQALQHNIDKYNTIDKAYTGILFDPYNAVDMNALNNSVRSYSSGINDINIIKLPEMSNISSTLIRNAVNVASKQSMTDETAFNAKFIEKMSNGTGGDVSQFIMPSVLSYIFKNRLYFTPRDLNTVASGALVRELRDVTNIKPVGEGYNTNEIIQVLINKFKDATLTDTSAELLTELLLDDRTIAIEQGGGGVTFGCWHRKPDGYIVCKPTDSAKWKREFAAILRNNVSRFKQISENTLSKKGMFPVKLVRRNAKSARVALTKDASKDLNIALDHLHIVECPASKTKSTSKNQLK